jgi:hypothetical protein
MESITLIDPWPVVLSAMACFRQLCPELSIWRREEAVVELNFPDGLVME